MPWERDEDQDKTNKASDGIKRVSRIHSHCEIALTVRTSGEETQNVTRKVECGGGGGGRCAVG